MLSEEPQILERILFAVKHLGKWVHCVKKIWNWKWRMYILHKEYIYFTKFGIAAQCLNPDSKKYHEKTIEEAGP